MLTGKGNEMGKTSGASGNGAVSERYALLIFVLLIFLVHV